MLNKLPARLVIPREIVLRLPWSSLATDRASSLANALYYRVRITVRNRSRKADITQPKGQDKELIKF